jgi:hypothetical protein
MMAFPSTLARTTAAFAHLVLDVLCLQTARWLHGRSVLSLPIMTEQSYAT